MPLDIGTPVVTPDAEPQTVTEQIEQSALVNIKRSQTANQSVETHSIDDLIKAAEFLAAQSSASRPAFGMRSQNIRMGGCG